MSADTNAAARTTEREEPVLARKTLVYRLCSLASRAYGTVWHRLRVEGLENLPRTGGIVLACNHQSFSDIFILGGYVPRHVAFVARSTLADWRWLAFVMRQCGAVLVKRGSSDRKALRGMVEHLEQGDCVAIFPEGTRTRDGHLGEFKGGALLAARMAQVPVVPLAIHGAFEAWPRGRLVPYPTKIVLCFGPPIDSSRADAQEAVVESIQGMLQRASRRGPR